MKRLLLALDASGPSRGAAQAASWLAAQWDATLDGLYVEDVNLSRLALHPDMILVGRLRRQASPQRVIASALRLQEAAARRDFEAVCRPMGACGSFHVRQGRIAEELRRAASAFDLLVVGWPPLGGGQVVSSLLRQGPRPLLLVHPDCPSALRPAVLDGDAASLALAHRLGWVPRVLSVGDGIDSDLLLVMSQPPVGGFPACAILLHENEGSVMPAHGA